MTKSTKGEPGGDYDVGYCKTPVHTRFKPGENRNPGAKRKRPVPLAEKLAIELTRLVTVTENGRTKKMSKEDAMIKALANRGMKGDIKVIELIIDMVDTAARRPDGRQGATVREVTAARAAYGPAIMELIRDVMWKAITADRLRRGVSLTDPEF